MGTLSLPSSGEVRSALSTKNPNLTCASPYKNMQKSKKKNQQSKALSLLHESVSKTPKFKRDQCVHPIPQYEKNDSKIV